jgi:hypothetical protein
MTEIIIGLVVVVVLGLLWKVNRKKSEPTVQDAVPYKVEVAPVVEVAPAPVVEVVQAAPAEKPAKAKKAPAKPKTAKTKAPAAPKTKKAPAKAKKPKATPAA